MGDPNTKAQGNRYGVRGPADNADPHIARQAALRDAAEFGMIGLLNSGAGGDPDAPTAPWGRDDSLGNDPLSARGNMWGDSIGESFGAGGLGLSGIGEGGGGRGEGSASVRWAPWATAPVRARVRVSVRATADSVEVTGHGRLVSHGRNQRERASSAGGHSAHRSAELRAFSPLLRERFAE